MGFELGTVSYASTLVAQGWILAATSPKSPPFKQKHGPCRHTWHTFGTFPRVHGMCHREVHQPLFPRHHTCHTLPILLGGHHTWGILSLVEVQALPHLSLSTTDSNIHAHQWGLLSLRMVQDRQSRFPRRISHSGEERVEVKSAQRREEEAQRREPSWWTPCSRENDRHKGLAVLLTCSTGRGSLARHRLPCNHLRLHYNGIHKLDRYIS